MFNKQNNLFEYFILETNSKNVRKRKRREVREEGAREQKRKEERDERENSTLQNYKNIINENKN